MQNSRYNKNFSMFYREQLTGQAKIYSRFIFDLIKDKPIEHSIIDYMFNILNQKVGKPLG